MLLTPRRGRCLEGLIQTYDTGRVQHLDRLQAQHKTFCTITGAKQVVSRVHQFNLGSSFRVCASTSFGTFSAANASVMRTPTSRDQPDIEGMVDQTPGGWLPRPQQKASTTGRGVGAD